MRHQHPPAFDTLRVCSLFSGIGGFELGLAKAGHSIVTMCESDPHARAVLAARFPGISIEPDVTAMERLPDCDLLTAGWPCQDLSQVGSTRGADGPRSGLVSHVFRLIAASPQRPRYVLLENVAFALDLQHGRAVHHVTAELEALGYRWAYRILDTRAFGLPQRRRRLFILAALDANPSDLLMDGIDAVQQGPNPDPTMIGFYWTEGTSGVGWSPDAVPPLKGGSGVGIPSPPGVWVRATGMFVAPGIMDAERLQGFPAGWTDPAAGLARGDRRRWTLVGNAVSVPVAEWLGRQLADPTRTVACYKRRTGARTKHRTPRAASGGPTLPWSVHEDANEGPRHSLRITLAEFGMTGAVPLSARAIGGFTRRYEMGSLRRNPEFFDALQARVQAVMA